MRSTDPVAGPTGYTLVELVCVLVLLAVGASTVAPTARRLSDRAAVVSAREEVVRALTRGRGLAVASGGSAVTVVAHPPAVRIQADGAVAQARRLGTEGVLVELGAGRDSVTFRFDRMGIGRFATGTLLLRRGGAEAGLVVSSYGRVRRR